MMPALWITQGRFFAPQWKLRWAIFGSLAGQIAPATGIQEVSVRCRFRVTGLVGVAS